MYVCVCVFVCLFCLFSIGVTQSVPRTGLRSDCRGRVKEREGGGEKGERESVCVCVCVCVCVAACCAVKLAMLRLSVLRLHMLRRAATPGSAFWWFTRSILRSSCVSLREPTTRVSLVGSALRSGRFPHQAAGGEGAPGVSRRRPDCSGSALADESSFRTQVKSSEFMATTD